MGTIWGQDSLKSDSWANKAQDEFPNPFILLVPGAGIEPAHRLAARDFKSLASTYSATRALTFLTLF